MKKNQTAAKKINEAPINVDKTSDAFANSEAPRSVGTAYVVHLILKRDTLQWLYLWKDGQSGAHRDAQLNEVPLCHQLQLVECHLLLGEFLQAGKTERDRERGVSDVPVNYRDKWC